MLITLTAIIVHWGDDMLPMLTARHRKQSLIVLSQCDCNLQIAHHSQCLSDMGLQVLIGKRYFLQVSHSKHFEAMLTVTVSA